jgi:glycosyltransferase involved in cell wall biosynthesis
MTRSEALLISVVIPAYNYAHLLPRALDSVLGQLSDDVELIVVDDGSTDNTAAVLADYQARHAALQVISQVNGGAAAARNRGIASAAGRYVLLLDADDELLPGALAALREQVLVQPALGMVLGAQISVYPNGRERLRVPPAVPSAGPRALIRRYLLQKRISISHGCSLFRRDLLLQRPYPVQLRSGEDIAVFAFLLVSAPVAVIATPLARIYKHADSLRHNRDKAEEYALGMVDAVFSSLPADCQSLRRRYTAQRYLSLFRAARSAEDPLVARRYYLQAIKLSPWQALRWTYLRKALHLLIQVRC